MVPREDVLPTLGFPQLVAYHQVMSIREKNMLGNFFRVTPPRFIGTPKKDSYEFHTSYKDKEHNLGLLESHGVDILFIS